MRAAVAGDAIDAEDVDDRDPSDAGRVFKTVDVEETALIADLNRRIADSDGDLDRLFVLRFPRRSTVPLALCGTQSSRNIGREAPRHREWRAEIDASRSGPCGTREYEIAYRVRWTSDWYRDF